MRWFGDESAVVIERYDRTPVGDGILRVEDLCQALRLPPSGKYQNAGGPAPADIAWLFRQVMPSRIAQDAVSRFCDAMIWNWLVVGTDGHGKNCSVLLAGEQVRMAPLYDVASALPYGVHDRKLRFAMKIGGTNDVYPHRNIWPAAARELGLDEEMLVARVRDLAAVAPEAFADAARASDVEALDRPLPARLVDLVSGRAARSLRLLGDPEAAA